MYVCKIFAVVIDCRIFFGRTVWTCVCTCVYICVRMYVCVRVCICMYVCMCLCVRVCVGYFLAGLFGREGVRVDVSVYIMCVSVCIGYILAGPFKDVYE